MSKHFIEYCCCGVVIAQCRCPGPKVSSVSLKPCTHLTPDKDSIAELIGRMAIGEQVTILQAQRVANYTLQILRRLVSVQAELIETREAVSKIEDAWGKLETELGLPKRP